jgi:hypothetical protein
MNALIYRNQDMDAARKDEAHKPVERQDNADCQSHTLWGLRQKDARIARLAIAKRQNQTSNKRAQTYDLEDGGQNREYNESGIHALLPGNAPRSRCGHQAENCAPHSVQNRLSSALFEAHFGHALPDPGKTLDCASANAGACPGCLTASALNCIGAGGVDVCGMGCGAFATWTTFVMTVLRRVNMPMVMKMPPKNMSGTPMIEPMMVMHRRAPKTKRIAPKISMFFTPH